MYGRIKLHEFVQLDLFLRSEILQKITLTVTPARKIQTRATNDKYSGLHFFQKLQSNRYEQRKPHEPNVPQLRLSVKNDCTYEVAKNANRFDFVHRKGKNGRQTCSLKT